MLDNEALKSGMISPSKYPIFKNYFWSNRSVPISLEHYICRILDANSIDDIAPLQGFFGKELIKELYIIGFYNQNNKKDFIQSLIFENEEELIKMSNDAPYSNGGQLQKFRHGEIIHLLKLLERECKKFEDDDSHQDFSPLRKVENEMNLHLISKIKGYQ